MSAVVGGVVAAGRNASAWARFWLVAFGAGAGGLVYLLVGWRLRLTAVLWPLRAIRRG